MVAILSGISEEETNWILFLSTEDGCLGAEDCAADNICLGACEAHYRCVVRKGAPYCYRPASKVHSKCSVQTLMTEKNRISFKTGWLSKHYKIYKTN